MDPRSEFARPSARGKGLNCVYYNEDATGPSEQNPAALSHVSSKVKIVERHKHREGGGAGGD